jgi:hypothetical protein
MSLSLIIPVLVFARIAPNAVPTLFAIALSPFALTADRAVAPFAKVYFSLCSTAELFG